MLSTTGYTGRATSAREVRGCGPAGGARHASISLRGGEAARSGPGRPCLREAGGLHTTLCGRMFSDRLPSAQPLRAQHFPHQQVSGLLRNPQFLDFSKYVCLGVRK